MNIKFESSFLMKNFSILANIMNEEVPKKYPITKDNDKRFKLKENEVMIMKILNSKLERDYKVKYNKKYEYLKENSVTRNIDTEKQDVDCDVMLTNKYLHIIYSKGMDSVNLNKIFEIFVDAKYIVIYTEDKKYKILLNSVKVVLQVVFLIDVLKNIQIGEDHVGKTIDIAINKNVMQNKA